MSQTCAEEKKADISKEYIFLHKPYTIEEYIMNHNENSIRIARYNIGELVRHRVYPFRGAIFDVDPKFDNDEEWWLSIPEDIRPKKDQPFYHLLAENEDGPYIAYVSEQNLLPDETGEPVSHPNVDEIFDGFSNGHYIFSRDLAN